MVASPSMAENWQWMLPVGDRNPSCAQALDKPADANRMQATVMNNLCKPRPLWDVLPDHHGNTQWSVLRK
jgi:hypothetical protein